MNPIRTNKPVFFADDGEPLASGYIYVGLPGQDPRNFPKTVTFEDSSGSQFTAAQPMRTNAQGQISYNGKAIIALVEGDYSLLIQDRTGTQTKDGWTPTVNNTTATGGGGEVTTGGILTGVTLNEIKLLDVEPGDIVVNAGKVTATDSLGAEWLTVAATGSPGTDVDLIDFSNGRQGRRIINQVYRKDILNVGKFLLDIPTVIYSGSGAPFLSVWNLIPLTGVPAAASSAIVRVSVFATDASGTSSTMSLEAHARTTGSGASSGIATKIGRAINSLVSTGSISASFCSEITVLISPGGSVSFDLLLTAGTVTGSNIDVTLVGYTIEPRTVI